MPGLPGGVVRVGQEGAAVAGCHLSLEIAAGVQRNVEVLQRVGGEREAQRAGAAQPGRCHRQAGELGQEACADAGR